MRPFRRRGAWPPASASQVDCPDGSRRHRYSQRQIAQLTSAGDQRVRLAAAVRGCPTLTPVQADALEAQAGRLASLAAAVGAGYREALLAFNARPCDQDIYEAVLLARRRDTEALDLITDLELFLLGLSGAAAPVPRLEHFLQALPNRIAALDQAGAIAAETASAVADVRAWSGAM